MSPQVAVVTAGTLGCMYACSRSSGETTHIVCSDEDMRELLNECPALMKPYRPSPLHLNGLLTTALSGVRAMQIPPALHRTLTRERLVQLSDGGTVSLDWWQAPANPSGAPVAL